MPLTSSSPSVATAITVPFRARACWIWLIIFSCQGSFGAMADYRHILVDQCDRAVFHLARRVTFRMDVGDFFSLSAPS